MTALVLKDVIKRFGSVEAVSGVSLMVEPGERRVIIGPNGAGKTTLFHCIAGTTTPTAGTIVHDGRNITHLPPNGRASDGLARTFQITNLFPTLTLLDNILIAIAATETLGISRFMRPLYANPERHDRAVKMLESWGLSDVHREVRFVSYGEQRQLELALALASNPRLLLLDEPMAGLSAAESSRVLQMIGALPRTVSVLMIEHDMDVALAFADRVTVMHQGRILSEGSSEAVRADSRVSELYLGAE